MIHHPLPQTRGEKARAFLLSRKKTTVVVLLVLAASSYGAWRLLHNGESKTRYVTAEARRGTVTLSVIGSGQVSAVRELELKPKVSGEIVFVGVSEGLAVRAGTVIATIDDRDARKAVRDAAVNRDRVVVELRRMQGLATADGEIRGVKERSRDDLAKAYEDGLNAVADAFLSLPDIITGVNDILFSATLNPTGGQWNLDYYADALKEYEPNAAQLRDETAALYATARGEYEKTLARYKATRRDAAAQARETLIQETFATVRDIAETLKDATNLIQRYKDSFTGKNRKPSALADVHLAMLSGYTSKTNGFLSSLLSVKNAVETNKETLAGADLDIADKQVDLTKAENALQDAQENLADYTVRAPFDGRIAKLSGKLGETVGNGSALATLLSWQNIAELSLNEVDAAKVRVGDRATVVFDAIPKLTLTGVVSLIGAAGTVAQGVVTYAAKIRFDAADPRVKPGMSVSASIITDTKQDALMVPSGAVKTTNGRSFVEVFDEPLRGGGRSGAPSATPPRRETVTVGLVGDTETEILSGPSEGAQVVVRTIAAGTNGAPPAQQQTPTIFGAARIGGGGTVFRGGR